MSKVTSKITIHVSLVGHVDKRLEKFITDNILEDNDEHFDQALTITTTEYTTFAGIDSEIWSV